MIFRGMIMIALITCMTGAEIYKAGIETEKFEGMMQNVTYDTMNFTSLAEAGNDVNNSILLRGIYKMGDAMAFVTVEGIRGAVYYGYENPQYNFNLAWRLMFVSIFAFLFIPIIYVLLFVGYGINQVYKIIRKKLRSD